MDSAVNVQVQRDSGSAVLTISGDLTFDTVAEILSAFQQVSEESVIEVALNDLGAIDLSGLQTLYAIQVERKQGTGKLSFTGKAALERLAKMAEFAGLPALTGVLE